MNDLQILDSKIKSWLLPKPIEWEYNPRLKISYALQKVLIRRGIELEKGLDNFLIPTEPPNCEEHFPELEKATNRIIRACNNNEKIAICGDYDADGMTSTVLLLEILLMLGGEVVPYIPSRKEDGYGLNTKMVNDINIKNIKLIITVDNGISAINAIQRANKLNIDIIITDHHKIPKTKPDIFALVHPELTPINSPYKYLAGVGIAYIIAKSICEKTDLILENSSAIDFFCIGTVADMAPIKGANRYWLKKGLATLNKTKNKGLKAIINKLSMNTKTISTEDIGFKIAPLINAVGRIGDPQLIIDLLTSNSNDRCIELIKKCLQINKERRFLTEKIVSEAIEIINRNIKEKPYFLIVSKEDWHSGIIGIVAARLLDKFNIPTAVLGDKNNGILRGSIRSNNLLRVNEALNASSDVLESYGGHSAAGGFSIKENNIPLLTNKLNSFAKRLIHKSEFNKSIRPESHLDFKEINYNFYNQLESIGPFGIQNPKPIFWTRKCRIINIHKINENHIKLKLKHNSVILESIKWNNLDIYNINDEIDIVYYIEINDWKQKNHIQLNLISTKKNSDEVEIIIHNKNYKCSLVNNKIIKINNQFGESIKSNEYKDSIYYKKNEEYIRNLFSFAEIALGLVK